jgi:hypothetical protein
MTVVLHKSRWASPFTFEYAWHRHVNVHGLCAEPACCLCGALYTHNVSMPACPRISSAFLCGACCLCCVPQQVQEVAESLSAAASSQGDAAAGSDNDVGLIPMAMKVIKTEKLLGCLRMPQVCVSTHTVFAYESTRATPKVRQAWGQSKVLC